MKEHPRSNPTNLSEVAREFDLMFDKACKIKVLKLIYDYQQRQQNELMSMLESLPEEFAKDVPYYTMMNDITPVSALKK